MKIPKSEELQAKDYGEESVNGSGIQPEQPEIDYSHPATPLIAEIKSKSVQKRLDVQKPEQAEDIMDFVEPEEYLKTEDEKIREWSIGLYFSDDNTLGENIDHNDFTSIWENGYIKGKHINNKESLAELRFRASEIKGRDDQIIKWQKMHAEEKRRTYQAQQEIEELKQEVVKLPDLDTAEIRYNVETVTIGSFEYCVDPNGIRDELKSRQQEIEDLKEDVFMKQIDINVLTFEKEHAENIADVLTDEEFILNEGIKNACTDYLHFRYSKSRDQNKELRDQLSEKDKQIEKSNFLREEALYKYSSLTDKYCNLVDQNIELKEQVRELKKVKPYSKTMDI